MRHRYRRHVEGECRCLPPTSARPQGAALEVGHGREVQEPQALRELGIESLPRLSVHHDNSRPKRLMSPEELGESLVEGNRVEQSAKPNGPLLVPRAGSWPLILPPPQHQLRLRKRTSGRWGVG